MTMADVTQSLEVNSPRDRIWDLLTDPIELARWWPDAAELEPWLGGRVVLTFGPGRRHGRGHRMGAATRARLHLGGLEHARRPPARHLHG